MNKEEWFLPKKGKRPNLAYIWNETYTQGCYVLWPVDSETLKVEYTHVNKKSELKDNDFDITSGKFLVSNDFRCIAFAKAKPSAGLIAHESMHLVNDIYEDLGIRPSLNNDEPQAYLLGWVVGRIYSLTRGCK